MFIGKLEKNKKKEKKDEEYLGKEIEKKWKSKCLEIQTKNKKRTKTF